MATPRAAEHRDLEQRIRDLEDQVRQLTGQALRRQQLRVDSGDFVVSGGGGVYVREGGDLQVEHDNGQPAVTIAEHTVDGLYVGTGMSVNRPDGTNVMYAGNNELGGADYEVFDASGGRYLASDGTTGYGLAIPHLNVPLFNIGDGFRHTGAWVDAYGCQFEAWAPYLEVGMLAWPTGTTECRLRLRIDGVKELGGGDEVRVVGPGTAGPYLETWRIPLHDRFALGSTHELLIEVRQGSGTDEIKAAPYYVRFGQS